MASGGATLGLCFVVMLITLLPQLATWQMLYGKPFVVPGGTGPDNASLFHPDKLRFLTSIYLFSPVLAFATAGLLAISVNGFPYKRGPMAGPPSARRACILRRKSPLCHCWCWQS